METFATIYTVLAALGGFAYAVVLAVAITAAVQDFDDTAKWYAIGCGASMVLAFLIATAIALDSLT